MPGEGGDDPDEELLTTARAVVEYTGLSLSEALDLPCDLYLLCYKNWVVERLNLTEQGREYLEECRIARQTEPDWDAVHRAMEKI